MAVFYTNFIDGNDSTGDGSWAAPYQTIYKATQQISANNDEVRVVGSNWSAALPGTVTFTYGSNQIDTSDDLTSYFPELSGTAGNDKVLVTINDEWGYEKTVFVVVAVTATTLTLAQPWGQVDVTCNMKRLETQHYYITTSTVTAPDGANGYIDAINNWRTLQETYTGIEITGGWTADGVRDGVTAVVHAGASATTTNFRFISGDNHNSAPIRNNVDSWFFAGFALANIITFALQNPLGGIGDFWFVRSTQQFPTSNGYMVNKPGEIANIYLFDSAGGSNARWLGEGNSRKTFNLNVWHSWQSIGSGNQCPTSNGKYFNELHLRGKEISSGGSIFNGANGYFVSSAYANVLQVGSFYYYRSNLALTNQYFALPGNQFKFIFAKIEKIYWPNVGTQDGVYPGAGSVAEYDMISRQWYFGDGTQTLEELGFGQSNSAANQNYNPINFSTGTSAVINTSSGTYRWTFSTFNNSPGALYSTSNDFVTGSNSLKIPATWKTTGIADSLHMAPIAILPTFTGTKTLTIKMKVDAGLSNAGDVPDIHILSFLATGFGLTPNVQPPLQVINFPSTPTTSFADYTFTIDADSWAGEFFYPETAAYYVAIRYRAQESSSAGNIYIDSISLT